MSPDIYLFDILADDAELQAPLFCVALAAVALPLALQSLLRRSPVDRLLRRSQRT